MDVLYSTATESLNETTFSACREYVGESTIRFDADENGNTPDAAGKDALKAVPPKTRLRVRINPPVDSGTAAAGDPITGVVDTPVRNKGEVIVRAGDKLRGRILRLEQTMGDVPRWTLAILFETLERNGVEQKVTLKPTDDGDRSPQARWVAGGAGILRAGSVSVIMAERPVGGGIFSFAADGNVVLGQKFESEWETR